MKVKSGVCVCVGGVRGFVSVCVCGLHGVWCGSVGICVGGDPTRI